MNGGPPQKMATKILEWFAGGPFADAVAGDLMEQYRQGRSATWLWRQVTAAIVISAGRDRTSLGPAILAWTVVILLIILGTVQHPASLQGAGSAFLFADIALLLAYLPFSAWVARQRDTAVRSAFGIAGRAGLVWGLVFITNYAIALLGPYGHTAAGLALDNGASLLILALFGATGSSALARTRSLRWPIRAGLWCACVGVLIALSGAISLSYLFQPAVVSRLTQRFLSTGVTDAGSIVVRNCWFTAFKALVRTPITAMVAAFIGAFMNQWLATRTRTVAASAAGLMLLMFAAGAGVLWRADSVAGGTNTGLILAGLLMASMALSTAHPLWSALGRTRQVQ